MKKASMVGRNLMAFVSWYILHIALSTCATKGEDPDIVSDKVLNQCSFIHFACIEVAPT